MISVSRVKVCTFTPLASSPSSTTPRLALGEHVAPVALLAHEVVHLARVRPQALDDLDRRDAAAHDHGGLGVGAAADEVAGVVQVVELGDAVELLAGRADRHGARAGGQQQAVVGQLAAARQGDGVGRRVEPHGAIVDHFEVEALETGPREGEEALLGDLLGQVVGEAGPRVVAVALGVDQRDQRGRARARG